EADGLIAAHLDRITRSVRDLSYLKDKVTEDGWNVVAVDLGLDMTTSTGRLMWNMLGSVAEWYRERVTESWDVARARAIERGIHISRVAPVGYRRKDHNGNGDGHRDGRLEPDPVAAPVIRELFERRASGESWNQLGEFMDSKLSPPHGSHWVRGTLTGI